MTGGPPLPDGWEGAYVFRVAVDPPGEPGWLYFRDNLWRGECSDPEHMRAVAGDALDARVERVEFRELRTTRAHLDALREAVAADLALFGADSVDAVLSNHLGSSVHVTERD